MIRVPVAVALLLGAGYVDYVGRGGEEVKVIITLVALVLAGLLLWQRQVWLRRALGRVAETRAIFPFPGSTRSWTFRDFDRVLVETAIEQVGDGRRDRYDISLGGQTRLPLGAVVEDEEAAVRRGAAIALLAGLPLVRVEYGQPKTLSGQRLRVIVEEALAAAAERPAQLASLAALALANLVPIAGVLLGVWTAHGALALLAIDLWACAIFLIPRLMGARIDDLPFGYGQVVVALLIGGAACYSTYFAVDLAIDIFQSATGVRSPQSTLAFVSSQVKVNGLWIAVLVILGAHVAELAGWLRTERELADVRLEIGFVAARYIATLMAAMPLGFVSVVVRSADPRIVVAIILAARAAAEIVFHVKMHAPELLRGDRALLRSAAAMNMREKQVT